MALVKELILMNKFYNNLSASFSIILFLANLFGLVNISMSTIFYPVFLLWLVRIVASATSPEDTK